jgi:uroporphyrinogen III methyltransferase/synthase
MTPDASKPTSLSQSQDYRPGFVYLVGAGPGDPGLITVRGKDLLLQADVVLYDGLVNKALLDWTRSDCECICVGKHGHGGMWSQREIDDEMVRQAKRGLRVVRLKGGDTAIFARTAEEVDRLVDEKIPFEVVPGITAALAAGCYTGIPLTHRDWSSAVAFITGQSQHADGAIDIEESLDWNAIANFPGTLVIYMGLSSADHWSRRLIAGGKPPKTPVALVRRCSWPDQNIVQCDLENVALTIEALPQIRPPVICIVGEVVQMARTMDWFTKRPWFGHNIWVTSPAPAGNKLASCLAELGANVLHAPVIDIVPPDDWTSIDDRMHSLRSFDVVVFSSVPGVHGFFRRLMHLGLDGRKLSHMQIAAVGNKTAEAIHDYRLQCDIIPTHAGAGPLAELLIPNCQSKRYLFVRSASGETVAMDRLASAGAIVESLEVYQQVPVQTLPAQVASYLQQNQLHAVTVTSKNIASQAVRLLGDSASKLRWLSLTPTITQEMTRWNCNDVVTACMPEFESLARCWT